MKYGSGLMCRVKIILITQSFLNIRKIDNYFFTDVKYFSVRLVSIKEKIMGIFATVHTLTSIRCFMIFMNT